MNDPIPISNRISLLYDIEMIEQYKINLIVIITYYNGVVFLPYPSVSPRAEPIDLLTSISI